MENTKKTIGVQFAEVKAFLEANNAPTAMVEFIVDRAEKSVRKSTGNSKAKLEAERVRNEIADAVAEYLGGTDKQMTITDLINAIGLDASTSKVTTALGKDSRFVSEKVKGKSLYRLA